MQAQKRAENRILIKEFHEKEEIDCSISRTNKYNSVLSFVAPRANKVRSAACPERWVAGKHDTGLAKAVSIHRRDVCVFGY